MSPTKQQHRIQMEPGNKERLQSMFKELGILNRAGKDAGKVGALSTGLDFLADISPFLIIFIEKNFSDELAEFTKSLKSKKAKEKDGDDG